MNRHDILKSEAQQPGGEFQYFRGSLVAEITYQQFDPEDPDNRPCGYQNVGVGSGIPNFAVLDGISGNVYYLDCKGDALRQAIPYMGLAALGFRIQEEVLGGSEQGKVPMFIDRNEDPRLEDGEVDHRQKIENNTEWLRIIGLENRWPVMKKYRPSKSLMYSNHDIHSVHPLVAGYAPHEIQVELSKAATYEYYHRLEYGHKATFLVAGEDESTELPYHGPYRICHVSDINGINLVDAATDSFNYIQLLILLMGEPDNQSMNQLFDRALDRFESFRDPTANRLESLAHITTRSALQVHHGAEYLDELTTTYQQLVNFNFRHEHKQNIPPDLADIKTAGYIEGIRRVALKLRGDYTMTETEYETALDRITTDQAQL